MQHLRRPLALLPVYLLFGSIFLMAGLGKWLEGGVPAWFAQQFGKTFLARFPGLPLAFYSIALLETAVPALLVISLVRGEPVRAGAPRYLEIALLVSSLVFCQLGFGLRLVNDFAGAASLFMYAVGTAVAYLYVMAITNNKSLQPA